MTWNLNRYVKVPASYTLAGRYAVISQANIPGRVTLTVPAKENRSAFRNHKSQSITIAV